MADSGNLVMTLGKALIDSKAILWCCFIIFIQLDDIAKRAGVGAGTLYRHFPSREALVAAGLSPDTPAACIADAYTWARKTNQPTAGIGPTTLPRR